MEKGIFIADCLTTPTAGAPDGSWLYSESGTLTTQSPLVLDDASSYIRMGLAAGSGAGSAASVGLIRLGTPYSIVGRHANDAVDYGMLHLNTGGWGYLTLG